MNVLVDTSKTGKFTMAVWSSPVQETKCTERIKKMREVGVRKCRLSDGTVLLLRQ